MKTLLLDQTTWDLVLDINGDIAVASEPYSIAQDVASACRLFQGEYWYDTTLGVPWFQKILGYTPPLSYVKAQLVKAALTVPRCANPVVYITGFINRELTGQVRFIDALTGVSLAAGITTRPPNFLLGQSSLGGTNVI